MIIIANILAGLGLVLGVIGLLGGVLIVATALRDIVGRKARAEIELLETENQQLRMRVADLTKLITRPRS